MLRVAIDGPSGTGKSTIAKLVAERFGLEYIDTGAMYRAIALKAVRNNVPETDLDAVEKMVADTTIDFVNSKIMLDGEDVSGEIRTNEISMAASNYSKIPCIRAKVGALCDQLTSSKDVVMEGRDICTVVIPDAEVKIFMTASPEVRAKRRYDQLLEAGKTADYDKVLEEVKARDYQDSHREISPLKQAEDAVLLDSSDMTIEENVEAIAEIINKATK